MVFWNEGSDVIIPLHDVINKVLSNDSNYIVDVVMWQKLGNSSISMRSYHIFEGCSWFKFNKFRLALSMVLKFHASLVKEWKLKKRKILGLILTFVNVTRGKRVRGPYCPPPILKSVEALAPQKLQNWSIFYGELFTWENSLV